MMGFSPCGRLFAASAKTAAEKIAAHARNANVQKACLGYRVFFRSVFSILRSAFFCALAYFFVAFCRCFSTFRKSRACDFAFDGAVAAAGTAQTTAPTVITRSRAAVFIMEWIDWNLLDCTRNAAAGGPCIFLTRPAFAPSPTQLTLNDLH